MLEETLVIIKPDGMQKNLTGEVLKRLMGQGVSLVACKMMRLTEGLLRDHYDFLVDKPFFSEILYFMQEAPVLILVLKGENMIATTRQLLGPTDSTVAPKGTIRGDFGTDKMRNIAHASDSTISAQKEISRFFTSQEIFD